MARRSRCLVFDARAAAEAADRAASIMAKELARDDHWAEKHAEDFRQIASKYVYPPTT